MSRSPATAGTDTHALIWWVTNASKRLGRNANAFFDRVDRGAAVVCIPTVCLVELDEAVQGGEVDLGESFSAFVERLETTPSRYRVVPLTTEIVLRSHELFAISERCDRLIAATAVALEYPLVTRDPEIVAAIAGIHVW